MRRPIALIGAPTSAGAFAPGQEDAPAALRATGLVEALSAAGREVRDRGDTQHFRWRVDHEEPLAMNVDAVVRGVQEVAARVEAALRDGELALVLGGDCTVGVGTVSGAVAASAEPRLVYLDLHADLNTPPSVPDGALDWTGVAHMLDVPGADPRLARAGPRRPLLRDDDVVLLGHGPAQSTPAESELVASRGLATIDVAALAAAPREAARRAVDRATAGGRAFLVHFDVDVIDFADVPLSENTGRGTGVPFATALAALEVLAAGDAPLAITVTELNPHHGAPDGSDVARFARALVRAIA
jgi:arginase